MLLFKGGKFQFMFNGIPDKSLRSAFECTILPKQCEPKQRVPVLMFFIFRKQSISTTASQYKMLFYITETHMHPISSSKNRIDYSNYLLYPRLMECSNNSHKKKVSICAQKVSLGKKWRFFRCTKVQCPNKAASPYLVWDLINQEPQLSAALIPSSTDYPWNPLDTERRCSC